MLFASIRGSIEWIYQWFDSSLSALIRGIRGEKSGHKKAPHEAGL
jgi:hypothetical protein